jgi:hypothetical protein
MTGDVVLIIAGCVLVLIGLLGGGISSAQLAVGKVSGAARILCGIIGMVLIGVGVVLKVFPAASPASASAQKQAQAKSELDMPKPTHEKPPPEDVQANQPKVTFFVDDLVYEKDVLKDVSEKSILSIDGKYVESISIDRNHPRQSVPVTVQSEGLHKYKVEGMRSGIDQGGHQASFNASGEGMIDVAAGTRFVIVYTQNTSSIILEKVK